MTELSFGFDSFPYPDTVTITRKSGAVQDPATGVMTPGISTTVLQSRCEVQEDTLGISRTRLGDDYVDADAMLYLPVKADCSLIQTDDQVEVAQSSADGSRSHTRHGRVTKTSIFAAQIMIKWL